MPPPSCCSMLRLFLFWVHIGRDWVRKAKSAEVSTIAAPGQFNFGLAMCTFVMSGETKEIAGNIHFCPSSKISQIEADWLFPRFHWSPIELKASEEISQRLEKFLARANTTLVEVETDRKQASDRAGQSTR